MNPALVHRAARTVLVAAVISGPIPSPGRRVTSYVSFLDTALREVVKVWKGVGANADADATRSAAIDSFMVCWFGWLVGLFLYTLAGMDGVLSWLLLFGVGRCHLLAWFVGFWLSAFALLQFLGPRSSQTTNRYDCAK